MRDRVLAALAVILLAGPTVLAFKAGGFFDQPRLVAAIIAWAIAAIVVAISDRPLPRTTSGRLALAGLVLLTGWTALSYTWAPLGDRAQADIQRDLLYVGLLLAAIGALRGPIARRAVEPVLALGTLVVTAYGMSGRLLPSLIELTPSRSAQGRLDQPLTYWNAQGALAAVGAVLCVRLAADAARPAWMRASAAAASVPLALGVYLSFSRGALLALIAGVCVVLLLAPVARDQARVALVLAIAGVLVSVAASPLPAVKSLALGNPGDQGQGAIMLAVIVLLGAAVAVAVTRMPFGETPPRPRRVAKLRLPVVVGGAIVLAAGALAGVAALEQSSAATNTSDKATSASRLGSADSIRYEYWGRALDMLAADPLKGDGTGGFAVEWRKEPDRTETAVDAHSLYIETLGELGIVGALFLAMFMGGILLAGGRLYRLDPAMATGPIAAFITWALHAGLDWDWEMPALTGIAMLLAGAMIAWEDEVGSPTAGMPASGPAVVSAHP